MVHDMYSDIAAWGLGGAALYLALGLIFAIPFVFVGAGRIDPLAATGTHIEPLRIGPEGSHDASDRIDPQSGLDGPAAQDDQPGAGMGPEPEDGDFYIGYLPEAPAALTSHTRRWALGLVVAGWALGLSVVLAQRPFPTSTYEYPNVREISGRLERLPAPTLAVRVPGSDMVSRFLLVSELKWGAAAAALKRLDGELVTLQGTLVYRDNQTLIEVVPGSIRPTPDAPPIPAAAAPVSLGQQTLRGEIVDSKCFLGVMNPGDLKVHRACATRCISGGIPPVLVVRDPAGASSYLVLVGPDGRMVNRQILGMIAEPVEITGVVERHDDLLILRADPATYRRLSDS